MNVLSPVGRRLAEAREAIGLNQERFAALGGVKKGAQGLYETGQRAPDASYLLKLNEHGIDIAYILTGQRQAPQESAEMRRFVARFAQLSRRERRAIEAMVGVLTAGSELDVVAAVTRAATLHDNTQEYRHED